MSTLTITEYALLASDAKGRTIPAGLEPALAIQQVTFTTSSVQSSAFLGSTKFIRVDSDARAFIQINEDPTATTGGADSTPIEANVPEFFGVKSGMKLAVISS